MAAVIKRRGAWYADFYDALGRRVQKRYRTRAEAEDALKLLTPLSSQRRHGLVDPTITVGEWVRHWLAQMQPPRLKPRAWEAYERACTRFIVPRLGAVRLTALRRPDVRAFLIDVRLTGRANGTRPLAGNSVYHVQAALRACLQAAVDDELLAANPAHRLGLKLVPTKRERVKRMEKRVLSADELATLTTYARTHSARWFRILLVYARAGLRVGELPGLEVRDFNPVAQILRVERAVDYRRPQRIGSPKNGPRVVDLSLSPELVRELRAQVARLKRWALRRGQPVPRWLFPTRDGGYLQPRNVGKRLAALAAQAGLAHPLSPKDLRHTYGTLLMNAGASPVYVMRQMGHASIQITVDTYGATARPTLPTSLVGLLDGATGDILVTSAANRTPDEGLSG